MLINSKAATGTVCIKNITDVLLSGNKTDIKLDQTPSARGAA